MKALTIQTGKTLKPEFEQAYLKDYTKRSCSNNPFCHIADCLQTSFRLHLHNALYIYLHMTLNHSLTIKHIIHSWYSWEILNNRVQSRRVHQVSLSTCMLLRGIHHLLKVDKVLTSQVQTLPIFERKVADI